MTWQRIIAGVTGSGRALFACPKCAADSSSSAFEINAKEKRVQCSKCQNVDDIAVFQSSLKPSGHALIGEMMAVVLCLALVVFMAAGMTWIQLGARSSESLAQASASEEELASAIESRHARECRLKAYGIALLANQKLGTPNEQAEWFYGRCLEMYNE